MNEILLPKMYKKDIYEATFSNLGIISIITNIKTTVAIIIINNSLISLFFSIYIPPYVYFDEKV